MKKNKSDGYIYISQDLKSITNSTGYDMIVTTSKNVITIGKDETHRFDVSLDMTKVKLEFDHYLVGSEP